MTKPRILIVEDDEDIRTQLKWTLAVDYEVTTASDRAEAVGAFRASCPSVSLVDLGLPPHPNDPEEGFATLASLLAVDPLAKVIIVTGQSDKENALQAVGAGAYDFLCKPIDVDALRVMLQRCVYVGELEQEYRAMQLGRRAESFEEMIGDSPQMHTVFSFVQKVGRTSAPVLILGESGTGKEMVARALHRRGPQKDGPFIAINCNAIPENLLESELFGHEKGAFTGAHTQRKGHVESAASGTLFLDEIGELPLAVQVKLLRFLQERRFQRVGGRHEMQSDARVIAATNANLKELVENGEFREDLYFRLAVLVINIPALRERGEDIRLLAKEFLHRFGMEHGKTRLTFSSDAIRAINTYSWRGNVRELQNRIQRAVIMADGKRLTANDLELTEALNGLPAQTLKEARETVERDLVQDALRRHGGKITAAALELGISRPTLYELMEKLRIAKE